MAVSTPRWLARIRRADCLHIEQCYPVTTARQWIMTAPDESGHVGCRDTRQMNHEWVSNWHLMSHRYYKLPCKRNYTPTYEGSWKGSKRKMVIRWWCFWYGYHWCFYLKFAMLWDLFTANVLITFVRFGRILCFQVYAFVCPAVYYSSPTSTVYEWSRFKNTPGSTKNAFIHTIHFLWIFF